jgi:hypothetical protein
MFFAEKKGLSGGLLMLLLEHSECDKYSELLVLQYFPSRMHRKEYGRLPFSRVPELFHVSAGLRFRVWIMSAHQEERPPTPPQTVRR